LRDKIHAEVTVSASWDYAQYPFDKQMVRMKLPILDDASFISYDVANAQLHVDLPLEEDLTAVAESLYGSTDWVVYSSAVKLEEPSTLVFELKIRRNAMATVFKSIIPMAANAILIYLSTKLAIENRLKVLSLSLIAASSMLNPQFMGLPSNVSGVPFIQSLVMIHILVSMLLLIYSARCMLMDAYFLKMKQDCEDAHDESIKKVWQNHSNTYSRWGQWLQGQYMSGSYKSSGDTEVPDLYYGADKDYFEKIATKIMKKQARAKVGESSQTQKGLAPLPQSQSDGADAPKGGLKGLVRKASLSDAPQLPAPGPAAAPPDNFSKLQLAMVELLLGLPALFHRTDPTRPIDCPKSDLPPSYVKSITTRKKWDKIWSKSVLLLYLVLWALDVVIYFFILPSGAQ